MGAHPCGFLQGWVDTADILGDMTVGLHRYLWRASSAFVTWSVIGVTSLRSARSRDCPSDILEQARGKYDLSWWDMWSLPAHVHLLMSEPEVGTPSERNARC